MPCCALVMLSERARSAIESTTSSSYACDLRKWLQIIEAYESGGHAYHATMPTDGLVRLRAAMKETADWGFERARSAQQELGDRVRALLAGSGTHQRPQPVQQTAVPSSCARADSGSA